MWVENINREVSSCLSRLLCKDLVENKHHILVLLLLHSLAVLVMLWITMFKVFLYVHRGNFFHLPPPTTISD